LRKTQRVPEKPSRTNNPNPAPLREGIDYYIENGRYVFTEHFLRQRGYCCQSGCRHCPYGFQKEITPAEE
jgi:hypothetical protein